MIRVFSSFFILSLLSLNVFSQVDTLIIRPVKCPEGDWELKFSEEFEGDRLNSGEWITWYPYTNDGGDQCSFCRTHGNEGQVYLDSNVVVSGGMLKLTARKEDAVWMGETRAYTSGMIHSIRNFGHGRYEARCRLPVGSGFWPAVWTFGQLGTEIDLMEAGMQFTKRFHTSIHNWNIRKMAHKRNRTRTDLSADFHVYGMEWDSAYIRFFIDDTEVWQFSALTKRNGKNLNKCAVQPGRYRTEPLFPDVNERLYIILNLAIGNESTPFTKSPAETTVFPAIMEVDYIRYYERKR